MFWPESRFHRLIRRKDSSSFRCRPRGWRRRPSWPWCRQVRQCPPLAAPVDTQGKPRNGFLRLLDIYNLSLSADVVVFSACSTAMGKNIRGEGLVGMVRGFTYAGAARVVAGLWRVDDRSTAELMKRFYRGMLKDGLAPAAALRAAQIEMSKHELWSAPYHWAAFVLQEEYR
jgi:CHAT domain-containing protein